MHEQDMIALLLQHDERGMDALLLHCGPLMRYIIAPIVPNALDREECLSEASLRVWNKIAQFDAAPRCTMRSHGSVRTTGRCFTGSITTCSPPHRSPPSSA